MYSMNSIKKEVYFKLLELWKAAFINLCIINLNVSEILDGNVSEKAAKNAIS